jgi:hippurate hydrolase
MLKNRIDSIVTKIAPEMIELRRKIHQHPELAFEEHKTAALVADSLKGTGIEPKTGVGKTGVVGVLNGKSGGPTLGIRADLDALPIMEATNLPFASKVPGKMHACGHDAHTVIALGVAKVLQELKSELPGTVKFIFQPAEETLAGAKAMIADGVMENPNVDMMLGYHNWPQVDAGKVGWLPNVVMASSDAFDLMLSGKAGHAAHPHTAIDTVVAAAHIVTLLQSIVSREVAPVVPAVMTIGQIQGGTARNIIAGSVLMKGTVRTLDAAASGQIEASMRRILDGVCPSLRVSYALDWQRLAPVLRNNPDMLAPTVAAAREILGDDHVVPLAGPSMGSEDFAWFAEKVPSAHLRIGSRIDGLTCQVHNADYDCNDLAIPTGIRAVAYAAIKLLEQRPKA